MKKKKKAITLAIGDGANDVNMIRSGKGGMRGGRKGGMRGGLDVWKNGVIGKEKLNEIKRGEGGE